MPAPPADDHAAAIDATARDWLLRLWSEPTDTATAAACARWRAADPRHQAAWDEACALWNDLTPLEAAFAPATPRRPVAPAGSAAPRRPWRWALGGGLTAGLALAIGIGAVAPPAAALLADHRTAIGQVDSITLPDGSLVRLNTDSAVDVDFGPERRTIHLVRGEAWFAVRKDATRPFEVQVAGGTARAVGTAFAIRDGDGDGAAVTVTEGVVRVTSAATATDTGDAAVLVGAGQQTRFGGGHGPGAPHDADAQAETAWTRGLIILRDQPLSAALVEIGRYRPGRIVLLADAAATQPVSARLSLSDLDGGIDALAQLHHLRVLRLTPWLVVLR